MYIFFFTKLKGHENVSFQDCVPIKIISPFGSEIESKKIVFNGKYLLNVKKNDLQFFR